MKLSKLPYFFSTINFRQRKVPNALSSQKKKYQAVFQLAENIVKTLEAIWWPSEAKKKMRSLMSSGNFGQILTQVLERIPR